MILRSHQPASVNFSTSNMCVNVHPARQHSQACRINFLSLALVNLFDNFAVLDGYVHFFAVNPVYGVENKAILDQHLGHLSSLGLSLWFLRFDNSDFFENSP